MALLSAKPKSKKIQITLRLEEVLLSEIKAYQTWAGIDRLDDFFEEAVRYVFDKDKEWVKKDSLTSSEIE